jgi:hypothetical protein
VLAWEYHGVTLTFITQYLLKREFQSGGERGSIKGQTSVVVRVVAFHGRTST